MSNEQMSEYTGTYVPQPSYPNMPFNDINQGTIFVESSRAIAEAQGKLIIAKRFPRDENASLVKALQTCQRLDVAESAFYSYPKGGTTVSGPSIRLAEELARCWGNFDYGVKELSRDKGKSEMQAYAWDMETNTISVQNFTNPHQREVNGRMVALTSDRDIYENNANMVARRLRARILAVLPTWFVETCVQECKKTLIEHEKGKHQEPLIDRIRKMVSKFASISVTAEMLEKRLGHRTDATTLEELVELAGIFNSIRDKQTTVADWFGQPKQNNSLNMLIDAELEGATQ